MKMKTYRYVIVVSLFLVLVPGYAISQTSQNSQSNKVEQKATTNTTLEDAIRKELQDMNDAADRHDVAAVLAHFADGELMDYNPQFGRLDTQRIRNGWREAIEISAKRNEKVTDEITKLYVMPLGADTALANLFLLTKPRSMGKPRYCVLARPISLCCKMAAG
jgi:ketosteroid isomerase-like protein